MAVKWREEREREKRRGRDRELSDQLCFAEVIVQGVLAKNSLSSLP